MESSLERVNAELASIFEATSEGILVLDADLRPVRMNHRLQRLWALPDDVVGREDGRQVLAWIAGRTASPAQAEQVFFEHFTDPERRSGGTLASQDGSLIRWHASPQLIGDEITGHVFGFSNLSAPA